MRQLVSITKMTVSDQRGNEHINGAPERHKARLVSEQDQQATAKFNNDRERSEPTPISPTNSDPARLL
jgi:hypothetical protein